MMIVEELRIGNHVRFNGQLATVAAISETCKIYLKMPGQKKFHATHISKLEPMHYTNEFMYKAGFELRGTLWTREFLVITDSAAAVGYVSGDKGRYSIGSFCHIHIIQNLVQDLFRVKVSL